MSPITSTLANSSAYGYRSLSGAAAGPAFESIATVTGNGSATTLSFSSIPSTYKHLQIRAIFWDSSGGVNTMRFNGDSGSNYSRHELLADGASVSLSGSASNNAIRVGYAPALAPGCIAIIDIHDYANTSKYKTVKAFSGWTYQPIDTPGQVRLNSGNWMNTTAISSITFETGSGIGYTTSTTFALYGIKGE